MKLVSFLFFLFMLLLIPMISHTKCIDFDDLTPMDPNGYPTDGGGTIQDGYQGFMWSNDRMCSPDAGQPEWATYEWYMYMGGLTYVYGQALSMERTSDFDIVGLDVGSYFYKQQDVYAAGWDDSSLKYVSTLTIDQTFSLTPFSLNFHDIDRFAIWSGNEGILDCPVIQDHILCIDRITYTDSQAAPVPEPSTLLLLGSGILGLARFCRRAVSTT